MPKATIKSKTGSVITIEGSESEISNILTALESRVSSSGQVYRGFEQGERSY